MIDTDTEILIIEHFMLAFFFLLGFLVTTYFSRVRGFLTLPMKRYSGTYPTGIDLAVNLAFFIVSFIFLGPALLAYLPIKSSSSLLQMTLIPIISLIANLILITIYSLANRSFRTLGLIKDRLFPLKSSLFQDALSGWKALLLSFFPLLTVMLFIEGTRIWINGETDVMQEAVQFLMEAKAEGSPLIAALFTIIIAAPLIEEYIFRGILQSYFRKKCGSIPAIFITSIIFSLFHFSFAQGFQNIAILASLFILSLYLGFIYEKTRSLISSITLHVTFNLINAIKIILYTA